jgi:hypothetical protein
MTSNNSPGIIQAELDWQFGEEHGGRFGIGDWWWSGERSK